MRLLLTTVLLLGFVAWFGKVCAQGVAPSASPLPGDMLVAARDSLLDGGGLSLRLYMPRANEASVSLYNSSIGGDVFRVIFDAVELTEKRVLLVYGTRLEKSGCLLQVHEYSLDDGSLWRILYSAPDPSADRRHCLADHYRSSPNEPLHGVRRQWMCAIETSNRVFVFNAATGQLLALQLNTGNPIGQPVGLLYNQRLNTLDLSLHCSSAAAASSANNRRCYVALKNQDMVVALDESLQPLEDAHPLFVPRPRWLQLEADWLWVTSAYGPVPELLRVDPVTLSPGGGTTTLPVQLDGPFGSVYVDKQHNQVVTQNPYLGTISVYTVNRPQQSSSVAKPVPDTGMLIDDGSLVASVGGAWRQRVEPLQWLNGLSTTENDLFQQCNTQPQHATQVFPLVGAICDQQTPLATPMIAMVDNHALVVYHAGAGRLGAHSFVPHQPGARWLDVRHSVSCESALPSQTTTAGTMDVLALDDSGALFAFNITLDSHNITNVRTLVETEEETIQDAVWRHEQGNEFCYATEWSVVCGHPEQNHTAWTVPVRIHSLTRVLLQGDDKLFAALQDGRIASIDADVRLLSTPLMTQQQSVATSTTKNQTKDGWHIQYQQDTLLAAPCTWRNQVPASDSSCQAYGSLATSYDFFRGKTPTWEQHSLPPDVVEAVRIGQPPSVSFVALDIEWIVARHMEDGIDERDDDKTKHNEHSTPFIVVTCVILCLLCVSATIPPIWCFRNTMQQKHRESLANRRGVVRAENACTNLFKCCRREKKPQQHIALPLEDVDALVDEEFDNRNSKDLATSSHEQPPTETTSPASAAASTVQLSSSAMTGSQRSAPFDDVETF